MKDKPQKPTKKVVLAKLTPSMTREQKVQNLLDALKKSGIEVNMEA